MPHFTSITELLKMGSRPESDLEHVGNWFQIDQARIVAFADTTEDHQWIHVDAERASSSAFGTTIAHGYLTLSLLPHLMMDALSVGGSGMNLNYGLDRVRFTAPVPVDSRVRARVRLVGAEAVERGARVTLDITVEVEGHERPALVATQLLIVVDGEH